MESLPAINGKDYLRPTCLYSAGAQPVVRHAVAAVALALPAGYFGGGPDDGDEARSLPPPPAP